MEPRRFLIGNRKMANLNELSLTQALTGLKNREFSSTELTTACLNRIKKLDDKIKAFVTITEELALVSAKKADDLIQKEGAQIFNQNPLLGIPFALKDNHSTKGILTTASSKMLDNYFPPFDATVTKKLLEAGAVLLGKTNMDAFAHGSSTETSDFFPTYNPWDTKKVPGGSSGGSAVAVSADMCIFAMGSETAGSVRGPAAWCGITGLKPSYGRVSRYGIVAMASSTDQPGPLTKNVEDAAYILKIVAGVDPLDATTSPKEVDDYFEKIGNSSLKGLKVGVPKSYFEIELEPGVKKATEDAIALLKENGAELIDVDLLSPKYSIAVYTILQRSEVSSNLSRLDGIRYGRDRSNFGFEAKKRIMLGTYTLSEGYYDAYYSKAQKVRTLIVEDFKKAFEKVDVIVGPSMPCTALKLGESANSSMFGELMDVLTEPGAIAGLAGLSVPCGFSNNMPVGFQFMSGMGDELKVLQAGYNYQRVSNFHTERPKLNE